MGGTAATDRDYLSVIASASDAIHAATKQEWIASSQVLLAMTALGLMKIRERRHDGGDEKARKRQGKTDRPRRPHCDSRLNRRTHSRHSCRTGVWHRDELDRRFHIEG